VLYELTSAAFTRRNLRRRSAALTRSCASWASPPFELMPIACVPGKRGWGYDGRRSIRALRRDGTPEQLSELVDAVALARHERDPETSSNITSGPTAIRCRHSPIATSTVNATTLGRAPALDKPPFRRLLCDNARYWAGHVRVRRTTAGRRARTRAGGDPAHPDGALSPSRALARSCRADRPKTTARPQGTHCGAASTQSGATIFHHALHVLLTPSGTATTPAFKGRSRRASAGDRAADSCSKAKLARIRVSRVANSSSGVPRQPPGLALQNHDQVGNRASGERLNDVLGRGRLPGGFPAAAVSP